MPCERKNLLLILTPALALVTAGNVFAATPPKCISSTAVPPPIERMAGIPLGPQVPVYCQNVGLEFGNGKGFISLPFGTETTLKIPACESIDPESARITAESNISSAPTAIIFVTDTSDSMAGEINNVKSALKNTIENFSEKAKENSSNIVSIALVRFSSGINFTPLYDIAIDANKTVLNNEINGYSHYGTTHTSEAMSRAAEILRNANFQNKIIILLSDGAANAGYDAFEVSKNIKNSGVKIYSIAFSRDANFSREMCQISSDFSGASKTGSCAGKSYAYSSTDAATVYQSIASRIIGAFASDVNLEINGISNNFNFGGSLSHDVMYRFGEVSCTSTPQSLALKATTPDTNPSVSGLILVNPSLKICSDQSRIKELNDSSLVLPPSGLNISNLPKNPSVILTWTDASSNETGFKVYRDGSLICSLPAGSIKADKGNCPALDRNTYNIAHGYKVSAFNSYGESARASVIHTISCSSGPYVTAADNKDNDCDYQIDENDGSGACNTCTVWQVTTGGYIYYSTENLTCGGASKPQSGGSIYTYLTKAECEQAGQCQFTQASSACPASTTTRICDPITPTECYEISTFPACDYKIQILSACTAIQSTDCYRCGIGVPYIN